MNRYFGYTDVELADIQATEGFLRDKLNYYSSNFPNSPAIKEMEIALEVLWDLESDLCEDDKDDEDEWYEADESESECEGEVYEYVVTWDDDSSAWGFVRAKSKEEAAEIISDEYGDGSVVIEENEDILGDVNLKPGEYEEIGCD